MKNTMLKRRTVNLTVLGLLALLFAGCAVQPITENPSVTTTASYLRTVGPARGKTDDLQPNPSDSPEFFHWGSEEDLSP